MKYPYTSFIIDQWTPLPPPIYADLKGKTVLVTGSNSGIGLEAAKHFALMQPKRLILGCRNQATGLKAISEIEEEMGYSKAELLPVDQSDFSSVVEFTKLIGDDPLDIVVLNAGVVTSTPEPTKDGWNMTIQVNHLSTALLALLLTPNLMRAADASGSPSRLVIVASLVHFWTGIGRKFDAGILSTLNGPGEGNAAAVAAEKYTYSKLLNVLFTRALASHLAPHSPLIPTAACPGYCSSNLVQNGLQAFSYAYAWVMEKTLSRPAEHGARQLLMAALGPDDELDNDAAEEYKGGFVMHSTLREPSDFVLSEKGGHVQERVWNETVEVLSQVSPKVREIVDRFYTS